MIQLVSAPPLPVLLVGCGAVSRLFYLPALRELARHGVLRTVAVVDPAASARSALATALGARACATLEEGLAAGAALAIIATPPKFHRTQTEAAFAAGLDVLCEKPLAADSAAGGAMVAAASRTGRLLAAGHYKRFFPAHQAIKAFITQQTFGALRTVEIQEGGKFSWPAATDSFFRREQTPGGVLLDTGVHVLDLLLWWLGPPDRFAYVDDAAGGLEANCRLTADFPGGGRATVRLSRDWATPDCYVLEFERATLHARVNASNQLEFTFAGVPLTFAAEIRDPRPAQPGPATAARETNPQAFIAQLAEVCAAVRDGRAPFVTGADGLRALQWVEQCYAVRQPYRFEPVVPIR